jgi:MoaA/NifB/PqqE/SkfB family radical SAM enzyme
MELLGKWRQQSTEKAIPLQASLELTYRCNERCTHCYIDHFHDDPKRIMTLEQWIHILDELRNAGTFFLIFMGGEAMLNPLFWDIAREAKKRAFHMSLITNGLKIQTQEGADQLREAGFQVVTFSLYSLEPEIHDAMTAVAGSHHRTLRALHYVHQSGIKVGINCLLTKNNIAGFFDLADWCIERGFEIKEDVTVTAKMDGDLSTLELRASPEQLFTYYQTRALKWPKGAPQASNDQPEDYSCNLAKGKCAITPYGDLLGCLEIRKPLGNLLQHSFKQLWNTDYAESLRNIKIKDIEGRLETKSGSSFCDHCPGMAQHECGSLHKATPFSQQIARIKEKVSSAVSN